MKRWSTTRWFSLVLCLFAVLFASLPIPAALAKVGKVTEYVVPSPQCWCAGITLGPAGKLWFAEEGNGINYIGHITLSGRVTLFPVPTQSSDPSDITTGPNGTLWFVESTGNKVGKITAW